MIRTPTTFVVGAGASRPYGLPVARDLHARARALSPQSDAYQLLVLSSHSPEIATSSGITPITVELLNNVLEDLRQSPAPSIDAFLESRQSQPETMRVDRAILAMLMGEALRATREHTVPEGQ